MTEGLLLQPNHDSLLDLIEQTMHAEGSPKQTEEDKRKEFDPLEAVKKHWNQAQACFGELRKHFADIGKTMSFVKYGPVNTFIADDPNSGLPYTEDLGDYQENILTLHRRNPNDPRYLLLLGIATNLTTCGQFNEAIRQNIPSNAGNHDGIDNQYDFLNKLGPCLYTTDLIVRSLGLSETGTDSPFNELSVLYTKK
ncbi:MAG: hypothetical protein M1524_03150 [Patescibacteria group bacterium]|nr:hypothetical protein [Patescibacteria group bacterium]